jgi:lactoylglutathione lyase
MRATSFNHVSIHADDLERSVRFYEDVFAMEPVATYNFAFPVQYFRLGDLQLHIFQRETSAPSYHHIGINVDDFELAYERAKELGILERESFFQDIYELPDGSVQMYIRDPAGNLVEIDWPDVTTLDQSRLPELKRLGDSVPQAGEALQATLYLDRGQG